MPRFPFVRLAATLAVLAACAACGSAVRADYSDELYKVDVKLLEDAKVPHGDADLMAFFQQRLLKEGDRTRIEAIVKKLSSKAFKEREQANADILKEGPSALPIRSRPPARHGSAANRRGIPVATD